MAMILVANSEATPGVGRTAEMLAAGASGLDAIEQGIRLVEADPAVRSVGRGGWANLIGEVELDGAVMDGASLRSGAVGGIQGFAHPISIARQVLERLPHELLIGAGAERFAAEIGAEKAQNLIADSKRAWREWFDAAVTGEARANWPDTPLADFCRHAIDPELGKDTTVFLSLDASAEVSSGVSTSGWAYKYPGRLGDSPLIGAGSYADSRHGAAACTGAGEMAIRAGSARAIVLYMKMGMSVAEAVMEAAADLRGLKGGLIQRITLHAIDKEGGHKVVAVNAQRQLTYWLWREGDEAPRRESAECVSL